MLELFIPLRKAGGPQTAEEVVASIRPCIKLDRALLCLDCESLYEALGGQQCPNCGSNTAWMIGRALNRVTTTDLDKE